MTYNEFNALPATKTITVPAREVSEHKIEITLPTGKATVPAIARVANQSPVVSATLHGLRPLYRGENYPFDTGEFAGGFQVEYLTYENGEHSNYLGNCYGPEVVEAA